MTILRFANERWGEILREYARVIPLAPGLLPLGLGLVLSQQAEVAEELRGLFEAGSTVDKEGLAPPDR